jgi:hypothetical protein
MVDYYFQVDKMRVVNSSEYSDYVVSISYSYIAKEGDLEGVYGGCVNYTPDPSSEVIPFNELTKETVIGWIESSLTTEELASIKKFAEDRLEIEKNPPAQENTTDLPWN